MYFNTSQYKGRVRNKASNIEFKNENDEIITFNFMLWFKLILYYKKLQLLCVQTSTNSDDF